jgi:hypothetical protein
MRYHHYENTSFKVSQFGNQSRGQPNSQSVEGGSMRPVEKWRERKLHETNLMTTASKFIPS